MWTEETLAARRAVLDEGNELWARGRELEKAERTDDAIALWDRVDELTDRYEELIPEVTVARCPDTWLAMPGAMRLSEPVEITTYRITPGPGVPYVVPRILTTPDTRA
ncbi:MAG: hypothetical protein ABW215_07355 [Kibdelosporangium sp.]